MRRIGLLLTASLLTAVVAIPLYMLATAGGARLLAEVVAMRMPLRVEGVEGSVLGGLRLSHLAWEDGSARVSADEVRLALDVYCTVRSVICLSDVRIAALQVTLPGNDADSGAPMAFMGAMPVIEVERLALGVLEIDVAGWAQVIRDIDLAGRLGPEGIDVEGLSACHEQGCIEARGGIDAVGHWRATATLETADVPLTGRGAVLPRRYLLEAEGHLADLTATLTAPETPAFGLQASVARGDADRVAARARMHGLAQVLPVLAEQSWLQLDGPLVLELLQQGDVLDLHIEQSVAGYAERSLPLRGHLRRRDGQWLINDATLGESSRPRLRVNGTLGREGDLAPALRLEAARLRAPPETGLPIQDVSGSVEIALRLAEPAATWSLYTPGFVVREGDRVWQVAGNLRAGTDPLLPLGSLEATLRDPALADGVPLSLVYARADASGVANLRAPQGITLGGLVLSSIDLDLRQRERLHLDLRSEGDLRASMAMAVAVTEDGIDATLSPFSLDAAGETFGSPAAVDLHWQRDERVIDVGAFCLTWQGSRGCSEGARLGKTGSLALELQIEETHTGTLGDGPYAVEAHGAGQLVLSWSEWRLAEALVDLNFDTFAVDPFVGSKTALPVLWEQSRLSVRATPEGSEIGAELLSDQFGRLAADLTLRGDALAGSVRADSLSMAAITDLVPEWSISDGVVVADLGIAGTRTRPELFGSASLAEGAARFDAIQTSLSDLRLDVTFEGRQAAISGHATVGGGDLRLEGRCCEGDGLEGILIGNRNRLRLPVGLEALLSPSLDFVLNPEQLTVTGSLGVHEGVFEHSGLVEGGVAVSDDVVRLDVPVSPPSRFGLELDLRALIEPGFTLRSKQIEATLAGDLRLVSTTGAPPSLFGNLQVLGGELRVYGQALRLTDGALGFVGDPVNPELGISAEREIRTENQRVGFRVRGSLEEPLFELFSEPQRPDNETLSYLLRGRGPDAGVSADGTAMALTLGATALNQAGVLAPLNAIPGLSGVTLGAEGTDQDMAATISAYVGNRLYLSYGVGIYEPINALTARLYLRSRLWLEVVSRLESSFDLYYRFDRE